MLTRGLKFVELCLHRDHFGSQPSSAQLPYYRRALPVAYTKTLVSSNQGTFVPNYSFICSAIDDGYRRCSLLNAARPASLPSAFPAVEASCLDGGCRLLLGDVLAISGWDLQLRS